MAGLQRMIKSGIRLYNYRSHGHGDGIISPINRLGAPFNLHRSFCSSSRGDGGSISPNVKWSDNPITFARSVALRAEGIPVIESQVLAEFVKELPESKFNSLLQDIRRLRSFEKESELRKPNTKATKAEEENLLVACGFAGFAICGMGALMLAMASHLPVL